MGDRGTDRASPPPPEPKVRLFLAVEMPPRVKDTVEEAFEPWRAAFPTVRWTPKGNWHLTLKFLGWVRASLEPWIGDRVEEQVATIQPFSIRVSGVGAFASRRRARVLWAGLTDEGGSLASLADALDEAVSGEFPRETRPFSAHLTVGRADPPIRLPEAYEVTELASGPWRVDGVCLFRSHLQRPYPRYEPLHRFGLGDVR